MTTPAVFLYLCGYGWFFPLEIVNFLAYRYNFLQTDEEPWIIQALLGLMTVLTFFLAYVHFGYTPLFKTLLFGYVGIAAMSVAIRRAYHPFH